MMQTLTVRDLARVLVAARVELLSAEATLNALNVFPVPDGDTGTNMRITVEAGLNSLADGDEPDGDRAGLRRVVAAMTRGAQGNSGVILSEYVRGFVREITTSKQLVPGPRGPEIAGDVLAAALTAAAAAARGAVHDPVDGTILSVADRAARAAGSLVDEAEHAAADVGVGAVAQAAGDAARHALERTPQQLQVLADSNVIDAGAAGLVLVLESLERVAAGRAGLPRVSERSWLRPRTGALHPVGGCHAEVGGPAFEVVAVVEGMDEGAAGSLRHALSAMGDSVAVAGGDEVHRAHIHTDDVMGAVSAMREAGVTDGVQVTRFAGPSAVMAGVFAVCRDDAVQAYLTSFGAVVGDVDDPRAGAAAALLADRPGVEGARTHHLIALLRAVDDLLVGGGAGAADGGLIDDAQGDEALGQNDETDIATSTDGGPPESPATDGLTLLGGFGGDIDLDDGDDDDIEVLRADTWRAARDLVRLHVTDVEAVVLCVRPDEDETAARAFIEFARAQVGPAADLRVLRLDAGSLVFLEVVHG